MTSSGSFAQRCVGLSPVGYCQPSSHRSCGLLPWVHSRILLVTVMLLCVLFLSDTSCCGAYLRTRTQSTPDSSKAHPWHDEVLTFFPSSSNCPLFRATQITDRKDRNGYGHYAPPPRSRAPPPAMDSDDELPVKRQRHSGPSSSEERPSSDLDAMGGGGGGPPDRRMDRGDRGDRGDRERERQGNGGRGGRYMVGGGGGGSGRERAGPRAGPVERGWKAADRAREREREREYRELEQHADDEEDED